MPQAKSTIQGQVSQNDPLKICINDRDTPYKIKASLELIIDGQKADIPANINRHMMESVKGQCIH